MRLEANDFESLVATALDGLPDWVHEYMDNVAVIAQPWPSRQQLSASRIPQGHMLLGLYEGVPLTRRGRGYGLVAPDRITLFQRPLESHAQSADELAELIRHTVIHEIAHHFGFSEEQLEDLGC